MDHFERYRESMAGAHGACNKFETLREQLFKAPYTGLSRPENIDKGSNRRNQPDRPSGLSHRSRQHQPAHEESRHAGDQTRIYQPRGGPFQTGLFQQILQLGLEFKPADDLSRNGTALLVHLDQRCLGRALLGLLGLGCPEQPALEAIDVSVPERTGEQPPEHERTQPDSDNDSQKYRHQTSTTSSNRSGRNRMPAARS